MLTRAALSVLAAVGVAAAGVVAPVSSATAGVAASSVAASQPAASRISGSIGDTCLVGHWRSGPSWYLTKFRKTELPLYGLAGVIEVHHDTGRSVTSYAHSKPGRGMFRGHHVREVVRGRVVSHLHGSIKSGELSYTQNVAHHVTEIFTYRHHVSKRVISRRFAAQRSTYSCSATSITTPSGKDTRIS